MHVKHVQFSDFSYFFILFYRMQVKNNVCGNLQTVTEPQKKRNAGFHLLQIKIIIRMHSISKHAIIKKLMNFSTNIYVQFDIQPSSWNGLHVYKYSYWHVVKCVHLCANNMDFYITPYKPTKVSDGKVKYQNRTEPLRLVPPDLWQPTRHRT